MHILNIPRSLLLQIMDTIGASPTESGGIFAVNGSNTVEKYYFDVQAGTGKKFYRPSPSQITEQVNCWLQEPQLRFGGYIHSHPAGLTTLSPMDIVAAEMTMYCNQLPYIYMLILCENQIFVYRLVPQAEEKHTSVEYWSVRVTP